MPSTLALGGLQRSIENVHASTLALGGYNGASRCPCHRTLALGGLQRSIEAFMPIDLSAWWAATEHRDVHAIDLSAWCAATEHRDVHAIDLSAWWATTEHRGVHAHASSDHPCGTHTIPEFLSAFRMRGKLNRTGWFPHSTFPTHLLSYGYDDEEFDKAILTLLSHQLPMVRRKLRMSCPFVMSMTMPKSLYVKRSLHTRMVSIG